MVYKIISVDVCRQALCFLCVDPCAAQITCHSKKQVHVDWQEITRGLYAQLLSNFVF